MLKYSRIKKSLSTTNIFPKKILGCGSGFCCSKWLIPTKKAENRLPLSYIALSVVDPHSFYPDPAPDPAF
jgi:hypothetical protein